MSIHIYFKPNSRRDRGLFLCCCKTSSKINKKSPCRDTQLSSSMDRNSEVTDTAVTDLHNSDCSKIQYCLAGSSDSSCASANSNHSKEYFTVGNRFDSNGLSSLLNDIIPDDDDEILRGLNSNYTPSSQSGNNCGTLSRNTKNLSKVINQNCLPNKSFNTYTNHKDLNCLKNSKIMNVTTGFNSSTGTNSMNSSNSSASVVLNQNRQNGNTLKYSNYNNLNGGTNFGTGSIRSMSKQPRNSFAFNNLRTNLDQEL